MSLNFILDPHASLTEHQYWLRQLWRLVQSDLGLDDKELPLVEMGHLHVRGDRTYWMGESISDDWEVRGHVCAFLAFAHRTDLIFQSEEHYQQVKASEELEELLAAQQIEEHHEEEEHDDRSE